MTDLAFEVVAAGPLTTVQDLGRPGQAHLGIPTSGALDLPAAAAANRAVGNPPEAAVLETTLSGPRLRVVAPDGGGVLVALAGASADVTVDGRPVEPGRRLWLPAGAVLRIGAAVGGLRCYLAVRGGFAVDPVLGSRSTDLLSGLGPPKLATGQRLPIGHSTLPTPAQDAVPTPTALKRGRWGAA